jgi:hypothetical protein
MDLKTIKYLTSKALVFNDFEARIQLSKVPNPYPIIFSNKDIQRMRAERS